MKNEINLTKNIKNVLTNIKSGAILCTVERPKTNKIYEMSIRRKKMKTKTKMKTINKITLVVAKIMEVFHWFGVLLTSVMAVCSIVARDSLKAILESGVPEYGTEVTTYGSFNVNPVFADGTVNMTCMTIFFIGSAVIIGLMAMVFRNVYLIIKTAEGRTKYSEGNTPFQKNIVRMTREIGIFLISIPAVSVVFGVLAQLIGRTGTMQITIGLESLIIGLFVLCLSQFFNYGKQLQGDVDGLV